MTDETIPRRKFLVGAGLAGTAVAAGMTAIGFVGGNAMPGKLAHELTAAGARTVIADMRALKSAVTDIRGW